MTRYRLDQELPKSRREFRPGYSIDRRGIVYSEFYCRPIVQDISNAGHRKIVLQEAEGKRQYQVKDIMGEVWLGVPARSREFEIRHKNGKKRDNRLCNLEVREIPKRQPAGTSGTVDQKQRNWYHPEHGKVRCRRTDLCKLYGLNPGNVKHLIDGKYKQCKGWRVDLED